MHNTQTQGNKMLKQKSKVAEGDYSYVKKCLDLYSKELLTKH